MSAQVATVAELVLASDPGPWRDAGFDVEGDVARVGTVAIRLAGPDAGRRIVGCRLRGVGGEAFDGLPISEADGMPIDAPAPAHPNGVTRIDHVVAISPDIDRTVAAVEAVGVELRRRREGPTPGGSVRQAFFRLGEVILEVVEMPADAPGAPERDASARFYGLAFIVEDLDAAAARLGDLLGKPRDAVQPGRRIATIRREAGLGLPVALMTPGPGAI